MNKYLVESPHKQEDCGRVLRLIEAAGYLTHFDWGCRDGVHCGWAIFEAESPLQALMAVPSFAREMARAIRLTNFEPEEVRPLHAA